MTLAQVLAGPHLRTETEGVFVIEPLEFIRVEEEPSYIACATCGRSICAHSDLEYAGLAGRVGGGISHAASGTPTQPLKDALDRGAQSDRSFQHCTERNA